MPTRLDGERPGPNRSNVVSGQPSRPLRGPVPGPRSWRCVGAARPLPQSPHGIPARSGGSPKFAMKTRQAFYLHTTKLTRIARRLCREILRPRHAARHPYMPINSATIKAECKCPPAQAALSLQEGHLSGRAEATEACWGFGARAPLVLAGPHTRLPTGTARLPEAAQSPLVLKQAVRKPLEAVLRYLGEPASTPALHRWPVCRVCA